MGSAGGSVGAASGSFGKGPNGADGGTASFPAPASMQRSPYVAGARAGLVAGNQLGGTMITGPQGLVDDTENTGRRALLGA